MFTVAQRTTMLRELLDHARSDPTVAAAALVGSAASGAADRWSDIDLALRLEPDADLLATADAWQARLQTTHEIVGQLDLWAGPALYRVFLRADTLQVDLSFWPSASFASNGEPFTVLFGEANVQTPPADVDRRELIGWAWLYALHVRSAVARGLAWRAVHMLNGLRDQVVALACLRHGLPAHQGRGVDRLPEPVLSHLGRSLVGAPDPGLLSAAFEGLVQLLLDEVHAVDAHLAARLRDPLAILVDTAATPGPG